MAAYMAVRRGHDQEPLTVRSETSPALDDSKSLLYRTYEKGVVRLTDISVIENVPTPPPLIMAGEDRFGLYYEGMRELSTAHGMSVVSIILMDVALWDLDGKQRNVLIDEIKNKVPEHLWPIVANHMLSPVNGNGPRPIDPFVVGVWAELYLEPLSDVWLAAMANHAHEAGNYFAFGYLVAQLEHQDTTEPHFLRGRKSVESGKAGAAARAQQNSSRTTAVLAEMRRLTAGGHSMSSAAEIAAKNRVGTYAAANKKLWLRHTKKES